MGPSPHLPPLPKAHAGGTTWLPRRGFLSQVMCSDQRLSEGGGGAAGGQGGKPWAEGQEKVSQRWAGIDRLV